MIEQQNIATGADAQQTLLTHQADLFLFDLKNEAIELGFKTDELWTIALATDDELFTRKRTHRPVISLRLNPQALLNVYKQVKDRSRQPLSNSDLQLTTDELSVNEKKHLIAYSVRHVTV